MSFSPRAAIGALLLLAITCGVALPGCRSIDPKVGDAFVRNREGVLARSLRSSAVAHERATDAALEGLEGSTRAYEALRTDADAYPDGRRWVYTAESRLREALRQASRTETVRDELLGQWRRDLRNYTEDAMHDQARTRLRELEEASDIVFDELAAARAAVEPVRRRIVDRALWLKHQRGGAVAPAPVTTDEVRAQIQAEAATLRALTDKAATSARALADRLSPEEPDATDDANDGATPALPQSVLISSTRATPPPTAAVATDRASPTLPPSVSAGVAGR